MKAITVRRAQPDISVSPEPFSEERYARISVRDNLNAPTFCIGDVLLADLSVKRAGWDGAFVIQIGSRQVVRWIHQRPDSTGEMGFYIFCRSAPDQGFFLAKDQFSVLAAVDSACQVRRFS